jgi:dipeptidyl aminopeptidase/acylaminoacyl peptidase
MRGQWAWPAALLAVAIAAATWLYRERLASRGAAAPPRTVPLTSFSGHEVEPALSPDGKQVAFVWDGGSGGNADVYVKLVDAGTPLRLTTNPAPDKYPAWSPDGRYIAFLRFSGSERAVFIVSALRGPERKLCAVSGGIDQPLFFPIKDDLAWSPDGKSLAVPDAISPEEPSSIFLVSVETGEKRRLTSPPAASVGDTFPAFSPDGITLAFVRSSTFFADDIDLVAVNGGEPRRATFDGRAIGGLRSLITSNRCGATETKSLPTDLGRGQKQRPICSRVASRKLSAVNPSRGISPLSMHETRCAAPYRYATSVLRRWPRCSKNAATASRSVENLLARIRARTDLRRQKSSSIGVPLFRPGKECPKTSSSGGAVGGDRCRTRVMRSTPPGWTRSLG